MRSSSERERAREERERGNNVHDLQTCTFAIQDTLDVLPHHPSTDIGLFQRRVARCAVDFDALV